MDKPKERSDYLFRWIRLGQVGVTIEKLIQNRGLGKIAIYGYDAIAECLVYELENSQIELKGIIDRRGREILTDFPAYNLHEITDLDIDAVIICPVDEYENIKTNIEKLTDVPLITFEELIYEL